MGDIITLEKGWIEGKDIKASEKSLFIILYHKNGDDVFSCGYYTNGKWYATPEDVLSGKNEVETLTYGWPFGEFDYGDGFLKHSVDLRAFSEEQDFEENGLYLGVGQSEITMAFYRGGKWVQQSYSGPVDISDKFRSYTRFKKLAIVK